MYKLYNLISISCNIKINNLFFQKPPNFLIASDLSAHVSPVVILPPHNDTPENETVDMNLVDTTVPKACVSFLN